MRVSRGKHSGVKQLLTRDRDRDSRFRIPQRTHACATLAVRRGMQQHQRRRRPAAARRGPAADGSVETAGR